MCGAVVCGDGMDMGCVCDMGVGGRSLGVIGLEGEWTGLCEEERSMV